MNMKLSSVAPVKWWLYTHPHIWLLWLKFFFYKICSWTRSRIHCLTFPRSERTQFWSALYLAHAAWLPDFMILLQLLTLLIVVSIETLQQMFLGSNQPQWITCLLLLLLVYHILTVLLSYHLNSLQTVNVLYISFLNAMSYSGTVFVSFWFFFYKQKHSAVTSDFGDGWSLRNVHNNSKQELLDFTASFMFQSIFHLVKLPLSLIINYFGLFQFFSKRWMSKGRAFYGWYILVGQLYRWEEQKILDTIVSSLRSFWVVHLQLHFTAE